MLFTKQHKMKKLTLTILLSFSILIVHAQQTRESRKLFKLQPFSLITGSLNVSHEIFDYNFKRSSVIGLGIRYINKVDNNSNYNGKEYDQFNKWQGVTGSFERRYYMPGFFTGDKYSFLNPKAHFGVYLSAGIKLEYNLNDFDKSAYVQDINVTTKFNLIEQTGKFQYLGVMPNLNIGLQYTIFQNLYIDTFIGGGLKIISKKTIAKKTSNSGIDAYKIQTEAVDRFVIKEGVQPNFGFGLGVKF